MHSVHGDLTITFRISETVLGFSRFHSSFSPCDNVLIVICHLRECNHRDDGRVLFLFFNQINDSKQSDPTVSGFAMPSIELKTLTFHTETDL